MQHPRCLSIVLFIGLLISSYSSTASENSVLSKEQHSLEMSIAATMQNLADGDAELRRLREQLKGEVGEEKESLILRSTQRAIAQLSDYSVITQQVLKLQKTGFNTDAIRAQLKQKMLPLGPMIRRAIANREREMDAMADGSDPLSASSLHKLEERHRFSDLAYQALSTHSHNLALLEFNNKDTAAYLSSAVLERAESLSGQIQIASTQKSRAESNANHAADDVQLKIRREQPSANSIF